MTVKVFLAGICLPFLVACDSPDQATATVVKKTEAVTEESSTSLSKKEAVGRADPANADAECAEGSAGYDIEECGEPDASVAAYTGTWKIISVKPGKDGAQAFVEDDTNILGSTFKLDRKEISWISKASTGFNADDVCKTPSAYPSPSSVSNDFQALLSSTGVKTKKQIMRFGCVKSGTWGPGDEGAGNSFFVVDTNDKMLLQWYDGVILVATRN
jgi:hypothetical protein